MAASSRLSFGWVVPVRMHAGLRTAGISHHTWARLRFPIANLGSGAKRRSLFPSGWRASLS